MLTVAPSVLFSCAARAGRSWRLASGRAALPELIALAGTGHSDATGIPGHAQALVRDRSEPEQALDRINLILCAFKLETSTTTRTFCVTEQ
jgi:hypothetical protein